MARLSARMGVTEKKQSEATGPEQRAERLTQTRNLKMARSAHAYVRGNTVKFYDWLEASAGKVPEGPPVWICGDCHLGNLGTVGGHEGAGRHSDTRSRPDRDWQSSPRSHSTWSIPGVRGTRIESARRYNGANT